LIPGVEVMAKNVNTGISNTTITNETGSFAFQACSLAHTPWRPRCRDSRPRHTTIFNSARVNRFA
jgi:protocatechuate 3,4-dioxygenase beta subunit